MPSPLRLFKSILRMSCACLVKTRCLVHDDRMPAFHTNGQLFILAGIQPTELCLQKTVLSLAPRVQVPEHLLYERLLYRLREQLRQLKLNPRLHLLHWNC